MAAEANKIIRIQGDRLADLLGCPKMTKFEIFELRTLKDAAPQSTVTFRGKPVVVTSSIKAISDLLFMKIQKVDDSITP